MAWSGGTYRKGNYGTNGWTGDASLGIGIEAGRHDTQDDDFASGINACLAKDGSNAATGNLNLGGTNRITNVSAGTARNDAATVAQVQDRTSSYLGTTGGTSTAFTVTATPTITALTTGAQYTFKANAANGAAATLKIDGTTATTMQRQGTALAGNEFKANDIISVVYDGTNFQITNIAEAPLFVDRTNNRIGVGTTTPSVDVDIQGTATQESIARFSADTTGPVIALQKSRGATVGTNTIVQSGDAIGSINFAGANGTGYTIASQISAAIDATPGATNDMPGRLVFSTTADGSGTLTERMRIDNAGKIGIGTNAPVDNVDLSNTTTVISSINRFSNDAPGPWLYFRKSRGATIGSNTIIQNGDGLGALFFIGANGSSYNTGATIVAEVDGTPGASNDMPARLIFSTTADGAGSPTERMRIDSSGNLLFASTSNSTSIPGLYISTVPATENPNIRFVKTYSGTRNAILNYHNGTYVGGVDFSNTATAFPTSSDYRLKENVQPLPNAIARLSQLKPIRFNFIAEPDETVDGFLAHEVQAVVPNAVSGQKDAVNDDGTIKVQSLDHSKLIPLLTAAIQELAARVAKLEA